MRVLQTLALPLGHGTEAPFHNRFWGRVAPRKRAARTDPRSRPVIDSRRCLSPPLLGFGCFLGSFPSPAHLPSWPAEARRSAAVPAARARPEPVGRALAASTRAAR